MRNSWWPPPTHGFAGHVRLLLAHGVDPNARERSYDATPAGWAEHHGQTEAATRLARLQT